MSNSENFGNHNISGFSAVAKIAKNCMIILGHPILMYLSVRLGASGYDGFYVEILKVSSQRGECEIRTHALKHTADFGGRSFLPKLCPKSCFDSVAVLSSG